MSRLEELIQQLCPDGVEYRSIGSLIKRVREKARDDSTVAQVYVVSNTLGMVRAEDFRESIVHSEDTSNYLIVRPNMFAYNPSRLNIGSIAMLKSETPGLVSPMYVVFSVDESIIKKEYFEYIITSPNIMAKIDSYKEEGARFRFDFERWHWIQIPIPPFPIQQEIVRILDSFTELTAKLTDELTARRMQYEYYRDELLTVDVTIPQVKLGKICSVITKGTTPKSYAKSGVSFVKTEAFDGTRIVPEKLSYIDEETHNTVLKRSILKENDILITIAGATIGKCAMVQKEILPANTNQALAIIRVADGNMPQYVMYLLQSALMKRYIRKNIKGSAQPNLNLQQLNDFVIPLPSLEEQRRIVSILDRFDALCNDLTSGLPAEIEARRKQYEYYRDKLLTFPKRNA